MSADALLRTWTGPARRRQSTGDALWLAPALLVLAALGWRLGGTAAALGLLATGLAGGAWLVRRRLQRLDERWLVRRFNALRPDLEDSAALLFSAPDRLNPLERLQRARIEQRLGAGRPEDLAADWRRGPLLALWGAALIAAALLMLWPSRAGRPVHLAPSAEHLPVIPGVPRLVAQNLRVVPPAYTGLPARDQGGLDARVPVGSRLEWTLRFAPQPGQPRLGLLAGPPLPLRRDGQDWMAARQVDAAFLYRVDPADPRAPLAPLHRIDVIPDAPPQVRVISPAASLTLVRPGQRAWGPVFAATDDYGVAAQARLRVTLAVGEGENVTFSEREIALTGSGPARDRRFAPTLDFARLGFAAGGDLVVQLIVRDTRSPGPQETRGPSLVLRWPAPKAPEIAGLEGMVNTTLPAYFRSQRQIILDAEALLRQKRALPAERFAGRSAAIGDDQAILRGRYSQFLGGEEETAPEHAEGDGHDHSGGLPPARPAGFGAPEDVLAEFGHPHDDAAASSLDPATRAILKNAVDEMWEAERLLKQGQPAAALPPAYRALRFIKQVQQATRVFLSRVGQERPPIDPARRLTGKRDGLASRALPVAPVDSGDGEIAAAWRALGDGPGAIRGAIDLAGVERWLAGNRDRLADPLALAAALDAVRADPACARCRAVLRGQLWLALARPPAGLAPRPRPDAAGQRYLRLIGGRAP